MNDYEQKVKTDINGLERIEKRDQELDPNIIFLSFCIFLCRSVLFSTNKKSMR